MKEYKYKKDGSWYTIYVKDWFRWRKLPYYCKRTLEETEKVIDKLKSGKIECPPNKIVKFFTETIPNTYKATKLCIKYPFLYPRNRWDNKHHANLLYWVRSGLYNMSVQDVNITGKLNKEGKRWASTSIYCFGWSFKLDKENKKIIIRNKIETKEVDISRQIYWKEGFDVIGFELTFSAKNPTITCIVNPPKDDETNYGFSYNEVSLRTNKFIYLLYKIVRWIDEKILDRVFCLPTYTELDAMEPGWRKAFGTQLCDEIKAELKKHNFLYKYRITQIKEKFASCRIYDAGVPKDCKVHEIINKYENISRFTCGVCGKPATKLSKGWIYPYCDDCASPDIEYTDINKAYGTSRDI